SGCHCGKHAQGQRHATYEGRRRGTSLAPTASHSPSRGHQFFRAMPYRLPPKSEPAGGAQMTEQVTATIEDHGQVLVAKIKVTIKHVSDPTTGVKSWHGVFQLPAGSQFAAGGPPYTLKSTDGRTGQILVTRVARGSGVSTEVTFEGSGPFARPNAP